jgi:allophycocyanin alpha subunit
MLLKSALRETEENCYKIFRCFEEGLRNTGQLIGKAARTEGLYRFSSGPAPLNASFILSGHIFRRNPSMSIVTKSIVNADAEARYLSPGELDRIKGFVTSGERRLRIAQVLTESRERIVKEAGNQLFQKRPDVVSPGGNAYGEEMTATCLRDMDYYLRLITYGVVAGDVTPIEEIGLVGVREMYNSLGTPIPAVAEAVRSMKAVATGLLSSEDAAEAASYFDYVVGAMQ